MDPQGHQFRWSIWLLRIYLFVRGVTVRLGEIMQDLALWVVGALAAVVAYIWKAIDHRVEKLEDHQKMVLMSIEGIKTTSAANHEMLQYIRDRIDNDIQIRRNQGGY